MTKTVNEIIKMHCHKGISPVKIFKALNRTVSCSGEYKAVKGFKETGSCLPNTQKPPKRYLRTKKLIKNIRENLRRNPGRSIRELAKEEHVSWLTVQRMLVKDLNVKPYKITKLKFVSDATKKTDLKDQWLYWSSRYFNVSGRSFFLSSVDV